MTMPPDFAHDTEVAIGRREAFVHSIPQDLLDREDRLPDTLQQVNASARSRLRRVYVLMDEIAQARAHHVACGKGCADCCRMNISITSLEAVQLVTSSGRKPKPVARSISHPTNEFYGKACPFLVDNQCSVYDDRPLSCRKHASYYTTNWACRTENLEIEGVPQVKFSGLDKALFMVSADKGHLIVADIRDFFPV